MAERYGPLVHRAVRYGAALWLVGVVAFLVGTIVAGIGYAASYSVLRNHISDLGALHCGTLASGSVESSHLFPGYVCSPWHLAFDLGIAVWGVLMIAGAVLARSAWPPRRTRTFGLGLFVLAGVGALGVGLFPEDANLGAHTLFAAFLFVAGNLSLVGLGFAMFRDSRWKGLRAFTLLLGLVGLFAFVLYLFQLYGPLDAGGMEWLVLAPLLVWTVVASGHLLRVPVYRAPARSAVD